MAQLELKKRQAEKKARLQSTIDSWKSDFIGFAKQLDVITKDGVRTGVQQSPILLAFEAARSGRDYVLKARQVFMTTWELARDIWYFMTRPEAMVIILCQSDKDNSAPKSICARLVTMFEGLKRACPDAPFKKISDTRWVRTDGGTAEINIVGAGATEKSASKKGRTLRINRLHVTEISFFEFAFETLTATMACVTERHTGSEVTFESTPSGAAGAFYEGYMAAKNDERNQFKAHFFPWFMQPEYQAKLEPGEIVEAETEREKELVNVHKITPEQLKWHRQKLSDPLAGGRGKVDQEFPTDDVTCWFFEGRLFYDVEALSRLKADSFLPRDPERVGSPIRRLPTKQMLQGKMRIWHLPEEGKNYVIGADPANGIGGDPVAAIVLERATGKHCATLHGHFEPDTFGQHLGLIGYFYKWALIAIERSSSEDSVHCALAKWERPDDKGVFGYPNIYHSADKKRGFVMSHTSRPAILDATEVAVRTKVLETWDPMLIEEMFLFIINNKEKAVAAPSAHDDLVMALAIAWFIAQVPVGLKHTAFGQAPSIAFDKTPVAFEYAPAGPDIDALVNTEKRKWAGASVPEPNNWGGLVFNDGGGGSFEGF